MIRSKIILRKETGVLENIAILISHRKPLQSKSDVWCQIEM